MEVQPQQGEKRPPLPFRFTGEAPESFGTRIASLRLVVVARARPTQVGVRGSASITALALLLAGLGCTAAPPPLALVLLITADTLRAYHLGAYGSNRDLTPNLDELARESLVFSNAYATAPFTLPLIASLMTGRYPEDLGIWSNESRVQHAASTLRPDSPRRIQFPTTARVRHPPSRKAVASVDAACCTRDSLLQIPRSSG